MPSANSGRSALGRGVPRTTAMAGCRSYPAITVHLAERNYTITDITRDATGAALGLCTVLLFNAANNVLVLTTTSDASGNYSFVVDKTQTYYSYETKTGATPVAGASLQNLVPA